MGQWLNAVIVVADWNCLQHKKSEKGKEGGLGQYFVGRTFSTGSGLWQQPEVPDQKKTREAKRFLLEFALQRCCPSLGCPPLGEREGCGRDNGSDRWRCSYQREKKGERTDDPAGMGTCQLLFHRPRLVRDRVFHRFSLRAKKLRRD